MIDVLEYLQLRLIICKFIQHFLNVDSIDFVHLRFITLVMQNIEMKITYQKIKKKSLTMVKTISKICPLNILVYLKVIYMYLRMVSISFPRSRSI